MSTMDQPPQFTIPELREIGRLISAKLSGTDFPLTETEEEILERLYVKIYNLKIDIEERRLQGDKKVTSYVLQSCDPIVVSSLGWDERDTQKGDKRC